MATSEGHDLSRTVALYARVSTKGRQEVENQRRELRDYCCKRGWMIVGEYVDLDSGTLAEREAFKQLFAHAYQLKFNLFGSDSPQLAASRISITRNKRRLLIS